MSQVADRLRLDSIKLVGFKSFVDPTTIPLPSNLVAVVGPNGCGKSNIIDAVSWVMGESSAKHLRGESMADVIFNGASDRKPVGQASIELIFDNPNGVLGGIYAQYQKIAIRRQITRDGQSTYFLNNTRCRRRDVVDLFLGTGLGPRGYSIIGQGTISRLIEAKPEELRVFLEEAAGISKYKERRRETENRIRHARENLERLNDLREELTKQLAHLQRQAKAAERYRELKAEEHSLKAQLQALRWQQWNHSLQNYIVQIEQYEAELLTLVAQQEALDAALEEQREHYHEQQAHFNQMQEAFYAAGANVTRLEQSLRHQQERYRQWQADLKEVIHNETTALQHSAEDAERMLVLEQELTTVLPAMQAAEITAKAMQDELAEQEQWQQEWQAQWEVFNREAATASQHAQVQQTRIQHLDKNIQQSKQRIARLQDEQSRVDCRELDDEVEQLQAEQTDTALQLAEDEQTLVALRHSIEQHKNQHNQWIKTLDNARREVQQQKGQHASLEALQQAALGQQDTSVVTWLKHNQIVDDIRLAHALQVESGWEWAVETVLGHALQAVCVPALEPITAFLDSLTRGQVSFFVTEARQPSTDTLMAPLLHSKIHSAWNVESLLSGVYVADDLAQALALRERLAAHESVVTPQGIWVGRHWLRVMQAQDENASVLQRQQLIKQLQARLGEQEQLIETLEQQLAEGQALLLTEERSCQQVQSAVTERANVLGKLKAQVHVVTERRAHLQLRQQQLADDVAEQQEELQSTLAALESARELWNEAMQVMETQADQRTQLQAAREARQQLLAQAKQTYREARDAQHQLSLTKQQLETELHNKRLQQSRLGEHQLALTKRRELLESQLAHSEEPLEDIQHELEEALLQRVTLEDSVNEARRSVQALEHSLRDVERQKQRSEQQITQLRERLGQQKIQHQAIEVRCATAIEQLEALGEALEPRLASLPEAANENEWEQRLLRIAESIHRLGAINLAAIDEYQSQAERKTYMDTQQADLVEALSLLEDVMHKIDSETRQRFRETYETVNQHFQELFPKIFGGGTASLALIGDDLLDTGVAVMARPPGKRNSTIHLLSGGEKALTAIALVFAIFQLNPSPFCLLDEVDAPLDDANVARFCHLVKAMSQQGVQFIFITHNKVAMEMAEHLIGVTMKEPGVSRMVSVDIEEAMTFVEV